MVFERNCFFGKTQQLQTLDKGLLSLYLYSMPSYLPPSYPYRPGSKTRNLGEEVWHSCGCIFFLSKIKHEILWVSYYKLFWRKFLGNTNVNYFEKAKLYSTKNAYKWNWFLYEKSVVVYFRETSGLVLALASYRQLKNLWIANQSRS